MKFVATFSISSILMIMATVTFLSPRHMGGPMNFITLEEPVGLAFVAASALILAVAGWKRIGKIRTWSISFSLLGAVLLSATLISFISQPPKDGISYDDGLIPPSELSMRLAFCTACALLLFSCLLFGYMTHQEIKMANKTRQIDPYQPPSFDDPY
jgi:hypothetical protein